MAYTASKNKKTSAPASTVETKDEIKDVETTTVVPSSNVDLEKENETLKNQMKELQAQMQLLMAGLGNNVSASVSQTPGKERYITFINLSTSTLILKGRSTYTIEGQFNKRNFLETEAKIIVSNMPHLINDGYVYIADADFVKDCGLSDVYQKLLNKTQLENLLSNEPSKVVEIYKNCSDGQKQIIESMVSECKLNGQNVDANILIELGKLCKKDFVNIEASDKE